MHFVTFETFESFSGSSFSLNPVLRWPTSLSSQRRRSLSQVAHPWGFTRDSPRFWRSRSCSVIMDLTCFFNFFKGTFSADVAKTLRHSQVSYSTCQPGITEITRWRVLLQVLCTYHTPHGSQGIFAAGQFLLQDLSTYH